MINVNSTHMPGSGSFAASATPFRRAAFGKEPTIFTDIYREETNIAIWQRELSATLQNSVKAFLTSKPTFQTAMTVTPQTALASICESLGSAGQPELSESIAELVDMFCYLFDLKRAGLRLTALDRAMCPKFHVDKVPCRLVSTYQGAATQWLPHQGQCDQTNIQQLGCGDVALLKGELWEGNENAGLVHRSPEVSRGQHRLLLTLDFIN